MYLKLVPLLKVGYFCKMCALFDKFLKKLCSLCCRIITGCYDSTLHLWTSKGKHKLTIPGHEGAVKGVAWVSQNDDIASFVR